MGARILVVDDEEVIREACSRILKRTGREVTVAADGREALDRIRSEPFDLILLDIKMPVINGMKLMDILNRERPEMKVVVITGHGTPQTAADAVRAGAVDFLAKPFSPNELRRAVDAALTGAAAG